jgi:hypothetical protein
MMSGKTVPDPVRDSIGATGFLPSFIAVRGHKNVLALHQTLSDLAERCGQSGVLDDLPFFLSARRLWGKVPHLLLLPNSEGGLQAAVLLYAYGIGRVSSGIFVPADLHGERTVLAAEPLRSMVAWQAAESLLDHGAHLVLLSLRNGDFTALHSAASRDPRTSARTCATRLRLANRSLPVASTFDATVATMGPHTRRNLRHYRRLVESELGATFVPEANLSESEFLVLNRNSSYPVFSWIAKWRFRYARGLPGSMFAGLRAADGSWLSMIGGRRRNRITYVDWQMNGKAFPALSIGTAMRAYLIEHEVARGTQLLTFEEGTTHSMNRAFVREVVCDLLLARPSLSPNVLRHLAARMPSKGNVLATTILKGSTVWHSAELRATQ